MDILEEIVAHKRIEIDQRKQFIAPRQLYGMVAQKLQDAPATTVKFATSLMESETGIIAEFKRMESSVVLILTEQLMKLLSILL